MKKKRSALVRACARLALVFSLVAVAPLHAAEATPTQTLDRVFAFTPGRIINMATGNAPRPPDFTDTGITGAGFSTCTLTAVNGLYCLDGQILRNWPNPSNPAISSAVLDCSDAALGLDRKSDGCTGMTVDDAGALWIAGKRRNAHSMIKVIKKGSGCPAGWTAFATAPLCAQEYYSGRPPLVDIAPIDGDNAKSFRPCVGCAPQAGVLGMEERKNAVFFPDPKSGSPVVLVSAREWGLSGKELLQDIALLQISSNGVIDSYIVATTSNGRILARNPAVGGPVRTVFDIPAERNAPQRCNSDPQQYGLRAGATAAVLYVTDRNYCQLIALVPDSAAFGSLQNLQKGGVDVVFSTVDTDASPDVVYATLGIAVAPGISFQLSDCKLACGIVNDREGDAAATLFSVQLVNDAISGATAFQVRGIPDCRYAGAPGFPSTQLAACSQAGIVVNPNPLTGLPDAGSSGLCGSILCPPAAQWLNVTPLLPSDVASAYAASGNGGVLPQLLISPTYRGQRRNGYTFEALFVVTQPGVRYRNTFEGEFDVAGLEGATDSLGCIANPARLIDWDVSTTVSEIYISTNGVHVDTLTNSGCATTKTTGVRLSLLPYDLELTPDTYGPTLQSTTPVLTSGNDAVFARLMQKLFGELSYAQRELACKQVDPVPTGGTAPLPAAECSTLASILANAREKLDKCIQAGFQPKQSAGDENCQSFVSQLTNFQSRLPATTPAVDTANRVGELKARSITLLHVYYQRYLPSIPANGFCRERDSNPLSCPNPWY